MPDFDWTICSLKRRKAPQKPLFVNLWSEVDAKTLKASLAWYTLSTASHYDLGNEPIIRAIDLNEKKNNWKLNILSLGFRVLH